MMVEPGITQLDKCVDSRYTLVAMAAKRARMIGTEQAQEKEGKDAKDIKDMVFEKPVSLAVEEIANGRVGYVRSEGINTADGNGDSDLYADNASADMADDNGVVFGEDIVEHEFCDEVE